MDDASSDALACPVCAAPFESCAAYDLHVRDCSTSSPPPPASGVASAGAVSSSLLSSSLAVADANIVTQHASASSLSDSVTTKTQVATTCARCQHIFTDVSADHVVAFHEFECVRVSTHRGVSHAASTVTTTTVSTSASIKSVDADPDADTGLSVHKKATLFPSECALCDSAE
ncbi:hypothetical protein Gpo141_00013818, partial [Globisporangium polare]